MKHYAPYFNMTLWTCFMFLLIGNSFTSKVLENNDPKEVNDNIDQLDSENTTFEKSNEESLSNDTNVIKINPNIGRTTVSPQNLITSNILWFNLSESFYDEHLKKLFNGLNNTNISVSRRGAQLQIPIFIQNNTDVDLVNVMSTDDKNNVDHTIDHTTKLSNQVDETTKTRSNIATNDITTTHLPALEDFYSTTTTEPADLESLYTGYPTDQFEISSDANGNDLNSPWTLNNAKDVEIKDESHENNSKADEVDYLRTTKHENNESLEIARVSNDVDMISGASKDDLNEISIKFNNKNPRLGVVFVVPNTKFQENNMNSPSDILQFHNTHGRQIHAGELNGSRTIQLHRDLSSALTNEQAFVPKEKQSLQGHPYKLHTINALADKQRQLQQLKDFYLKYCNCYKCHRGLNNHCRIIQRLFFKTKQQIVTQMFLTSLIL